MLTEESTRPDVHSRADRLLRPTKNATGEMGFRDADERLRFRIR